MEAFEEGEVEVDEVVVEVVLIDMTKDLQNRYCDFTKCSSVV